MNDVDGVVWGGGSDYKVRFAPDEVEFTPALGRAAEHNLPLTFSTLSIGREATAQPVAVVTPRRVGAAMVEYDRAPGVVERHEVRADGLELSFELAASPTGTGDLVVQLRLRSELPLELGDAGLRCVLPGVGGVAWGAVTGVDAQGHSVQGGLRLQGSVLELSLPASFVDAAAYPIVLDPFVYPVIPLAVDALHREDNPDVAYESTGDRYLVVWRKEYSSSDSDIRGQFFDGNGGIDPSGYWVIEVASDTQAIHPAVASASASSRFMVVWPQRITSAAPFDLLGRSISTAGFGMSSIVTIAVGGSIDPQFTDAGGFSTPGVNAVSVVWQESNPGPSGDNRIMHRSVGVPFQGNPSVAASIETLVGSWASAPAISKGSGPSNWHLVVYSRWYSIPPDSGHHDVEATLIDQSGGVIWGPAPLVTTVGPDEIELDVDGDGSVFFSVFARQPNYTTAVASLHAVRTVLGGGGFSSIETTIDDNIAVGQDARQPSVAFTGNGALVAWAKSFAFQDYDIAVVALDPWANTIADPLAFADFETTFAIGPKLGAKYSANHALGDGVLCAWELITPSTFDWDLLTAAIDPELGIVTDLGGATALGGKASVSAATVGNSGFTHFYDGLYGFNTVTLLVGATAISAPFCTGTLVPQPTYMLHLVTKADSTLVLPSPLPANPALLGFTFYEQYVESDPFTPPCGKNLQLSNALAITIE